MASSLHEKPLQGDIWIFRLDISALQAHFLVCRFLATTTCKMVAVKKNWSVNVNWQVIYFEILWSPIGDLNRKFTRQFYFSLAMATKLVAAWSAVFRLDIFFINTTTMIPCRCTPQREFAITGITRVLIIINYLHAFTFVMFSFPKISIHSP